MEASQRFKNLLHQIENSKLNYVITKTPFSANISVKRSLIKFHDEDISENRKDVKQEIFANGNAKQDLRLEEVLKQNERLQELFKEQNSKVKAAESEVASLK